MYKQFLLKLLKFNKKFDILLKFYLLTITCLYKSSVFKYLAIFFYHK